MRGLVQLWNATAARAAQWSVVWWKDGGEAGLNVGGGFHLVWLRYAEIY